MDWTGGDGDGQDEEGGPGLDEFLASDPSELPFLQGLEPSADAVEYRVFADAVSARSGEQQHHLEEQLAQLRETLLAMAAEVVGDHIWHCEPLNLSVRVPQPPPTPLTSNKAPGANAASTSLGLNISDLREEADGGSCTSPMCAPPSPQAIAAETSYRKRQKQVPLPLEPHLYGRSVYGDNVEDEWLIVHLLSRATRQFPGLSATVTDADGEFLLIEAADAIPHFLDPQNSRHRVWLRGGDVHLLLPAPAGAHHTSPTAAAAAQKPGHLSLPEGLALLRSCTARAASDSVAAPEVQRAIAQRAGAFPAKLSQDAHSARAFLPRAAAAALRRRPALVAAAVRAYCSRDPSEGASAARMAALGGGGCVELRLRLTRHLYAQASAAPPMAALRAFPPGWAPPGGAAHLTAAAASRAAELGQKLSIGLEVLYARAQCAAAAEADAAAARCGPRSPRAVEAEAAASGGAAAAVEALPVAFVHSLEDSGYFEGALRGSQAYDDKLRQAAAFYERHGADAGGAAPLLGGSAVDDFERRELLSALPLLRDCTSLCSAGGGGGGSGGGSGGSSGSCGGSGATSDAAGGGGDGGGQPWEGEFPPVVQPDDDDSWMGVTAGELEALLSRANRVTLSTAPPPPPAEPAPGEELPYGWGGIEDDAESVGDPGEVFDEMVRGVRAFVGEARSGVEGAEFPEDGGGGGDGDGGRMSFDVDKFMRLLEGIDDDFDGDGTYDSDEGDEEASFHGSDASMDDVAGSAAATGCGGGSGGSGGGGVRVGVGAAGGGAPVREVACDVDSDDELDGDAALAAAEHGHAAAAAQQTAALAQRAEWEVETDNLYISACAAAMEEQLEDHERGADTAARAREAAAAQLAHAKSVGPLPAAPDSDYGEGEGGGGLGGSYEAAPARAQQEGGEEGDPFAGLGSGAPVDVDVNLVKQLLESFSAQEGRPGPASNLLHELGLRMPLGEEQERVPPPHS